MFAVTLWLTGGIAVTELILSQFVITGATGVSAGMLVQMVLVVALCGLIVDVLRYVAANLSLKPHRSLKRKRVGKDMRRLLERSLGPAQQV